MTAPIDWTDEVTVTSPYESPVLERSMYTHKRVTVVVFAVPWATPANASMVNPPIPPTTTSATTTPDAIAHLPRMCPPVALTRPPLKMRWPAQRSCGWRGEYATVQDPLKAPSGFEPL